MLREHQTKSVLGVQASLYITVYCLIVYIHDSSFHHYASLYIFADLHWSTEKAEQEAEVHRLSESLYLKTTGGLYGGVS